MVMHSDSMKDMVTGAVRGVIRHRGPVVTTVSAAVMSVGFYYLWSVHGGGNI